MDESSIFKIDEIVTSSPKPSSSRSSKNPGTKNKTKTNQGNVDQFQNLNKWKKAAWLFLIWLKPKPNIICDQE